MMQADNKPAEHYFKNVKECLLDDLGDAYSK
jgi:hypothetical protein